MVVVAIIFLYIYSANDDVVLNNENKLTIDSVISSRVIQQHAAIPTIKRSDAFNKASQDEDRKSISKIKKVSILERVSDLRLFLDEKPVRERSPTEQLSLAQELTMCSQLPLNNPSKLDELKDIMYFKFGSETILNSFSQQVENCQSVSLDELKLSYDLIVKHSKSGDIDAVNLLLSANHPAYIEEIQKNYPSGDDFDYQKYKDEIYDSHFPTIERSAQKGNLRAAKYLAMQYSNGAIGPKDKVKSLSYYLALKNVSRISNYDNSIDAITSSLSNKDLNVAIKQSKDLIENWAELDTLYQ
ncbi:MAG: hypothetical protein V2I33_07695 [Kangiellaceae bacterium]|jgi:hypothetical protein|nr:hypothetical protein [Kangiellaceae bacterium]